MTTDLLQYPLCEWMHRIVSEAFQTMLSLPAVPTFEHQPLPSESAERITAAIGIAGESLTGAVYLHLSLPFAREITALMLGYEQGASPAPAEINDVVGEFCNMVGGGLKSTLGNNGAPCAMSPPSIIRGASFVIEPMPEAHVETFYFDCLSHRLAVEIHLQPSEL